MEIFLVQQDLHYEGQRNISAHVSKTVAEKKAAEYRAEDVARLRERYPHMPSRWESDAGVYVIEAIELDTSTTPLSYLP